MTTGDVRVSAWNLRASAGSTRLATITWADEGDPGFDLEDHEFTIEIDGDEQLVTVDGNVATVTLVFPDQEGSVPLAALLDGIPQTTGHVYLSERGTDDFDSTVEVIATSFTFVIEVIGGGVSTGDLLAEAAIRAAADAALDLRVDALEADDSGDDAAIAAVAANLVSEAATRAAADANLQAQIDDFDDVFASLRRWNLRQFGDVVFDSEPGDMGTDNGPTLIAAIAHIEAVGGHGTLFVEAGPDDDGWLGFTTGAQVQDIDGLTIDFGGCRVLNDATVTYTEYADNPTNPGGAATTNALMQVQDCDDFVVKGCERVKAVTAGVWHHINTIANNGSGKIRVVTGVNHQLTTGDEIVVRGAHNGYGEWTPGVNSYDPLQDPKVNNTVSAQEPADPSRPAFWTVTVINSTTFDLNESTYNADDNTGRFESRVFGSGKVARFRGIMRRTVVEDVWAEDHQQFAFTWGDIRPDPAVTFYDEFTFRRVRITGECGAVGDGSGIDFFPRTNPGASSSLTLTPDPDEVPTCRELVFEDVYIDVTRGYDDTREHGPQCIKTSNVDGVTHRGSLNYRGGSTGVLTHTNGTRRGRLDGTLLLQKGNRRLNLNCTRGLTVSAVTQDIDFSGGKVICERDGAISGEDYGVYVEHVRDVHFGVLDSDGDVLLAMDEVVQDPDLPGYGSQTFTHQFHNVRIDDLTLRGASFDFVTPTDELGANRTVEPFYGLVLGNITSKENGAGSGGGRVRAGQDGYWKANGVVLGSLKVEGQDLPSALEVYGDDADIGPVESIDGNPSNDGSVAVVVDRGNRSQFASISLGAATPIADVASIANNGGLVRVVTAAAHGLVAGAVVTIVGSHASANGEHRITVIDTTTFDLVGSTFSATAGAGGTVAAHYVDWHYRRPVAGFGRVDNIGGLGSTTHFSLTAGAADFVPPPVQTVAYAASVTIEPLLGRLVNVGVLTGDITFANPAVGDRFVGQELVVEVTQDATGSRAVTWGNAWVVRADVNPTPDSVTSWRFVYDGAKYRQDAAGIPSNVAHKATGLVGATTGGRFVGATGSVAPTTGTFAARDFVVATNGTLWVCTVAGTPGTWVQANSAYADAKVAQTITDGVTTSAPSQDAVFDALALKAALASPALTGNPTAPTQSAGNNSTRLATTAYADAKVADAINDGTTAIAPSQNAVFDALALKTGLLARVAYNPASPVLYSTTSSTFSDVDATNLVVAFTVPASGSVIIILEGWTFVAGATATAWCLRDGSGTIAGTERLVTATTAAMRLSSSFRVTGLTPGASLSWKWGYASADNTNTARIRAGVVAFPSITAAGPAIMEAWAV